MKKIFLLVTVSLLILPLSAQFKAKMVFNTMGKERAYTVYSANEGYRYEFNEDGQEGVVIVLNETGEVFILMPQQKMAMKTAAGNPMSMQNDPVGSFEYYKKDGTVKEIGTETINGVKCTKSELWNITGDEYGQVTQKMFTIWTSDKYKFPMKMINHIDGAEGSGMELKDIEPWTLDAASFTIPEGYQVMDMPDMMHDK